MASHQLAIAKASFSACLLRPDPTSVSRDGIEQFHGILNATITQCSPKNVQKCKYWILDNVAQSAARFLSLGKYLTALAASFATSPETRRPSLKRKRLHILYLINDILHHGKVHKDVSICGKVQSMLMGLVGSAASFKDCPKHHRKIQALLDIWEEKDYYGASYVDKLRETASHAAEGGDDAENTSLSGSKDDISTSKSTKSAPYVMPASHGDASTPWFDLPAANLMPHLIPNSIKPINPEMIKPLQFIAGPADESLVAAVKALLDDVEVIFGESSKDMKDSWDIDELGQSIILDEITGDITGGEGYYGWSRTFCEKIKRRKKGLDLPDGDEERGRDSRSRSSSRSVRKRRHSDSSDGSSRNRFRSRQRRRSYSSSRSPTPDRSQSRHSGHNSRDRFDSPRRSATPPRRANSPPKENIPPPNPYQTMQYPPPPPPIPIQAFQQGYNPNFPPPPPPPMPYNNQGFSTPGFNGQTPQFGSWPPPPPPPNMNFNASQPWPPPPPPPGNPPMHFQQHQNPHQQFPGAYPPAGPGNWQQQQQQQQGDGRGYKNNTGGWNNGPPNRGRGNFRGRGRGW